MHHKIYREGFCKKADNMGCVLEWTRSIGKVMGNFQILYALHTSLHYVIQFYCRDDSVAEFIFRLLLNMLINFTIG